MSGSKTTPRVGDFELLAKLGEGGMGAVYQARQTSLDRIVALKILSPRHARNEEFVQRFQQEARATARLNHPNIVAATAVGYADGYYYFAMEYVEGESLKARLLRQGALAESEVVRIGAAIAGALAHAHEAGILHRDVKPDNILIDRYGNPKLTDLGLAKLQEREDGSLTKSGATVGTPHYIAPEQASGEKDLDGRVDIYSLGCSLYHAATGNTPFDAPNAAILMVKHLNEKMQHPQAHRPELSDAFCNVLDHMVARHREDRYEGMVEAAADLEALQRGDEPAVEAQPPGRSNFSSGARVAKLTGSRKALTPERGHTSRLLPVANATRQNERRQPPRRGGNSSGALMLAGGFALAVVVAVVLLMRGGSGDATRTGSGETDGRPPAESKAVPKQPGEVPQERPVSNNGELLFNGQDLAGWRAVAPEWRAEKGELVGAAMGRGLAVLNLNRPLTPDFELSFTITRFGSFHLDWTYGAEPTDSLLRDPVRGYRFNRYHGPEKPLQELAAGPPRAGSRPEQVRLVVKGSRLELYVDGKLEIQSFGGVVLQGRMRQLNLFVHPTHTVALKDLRLKEHEAPAVAVAAPAATAEPLDDYCRAIAALQPVEQVAKVVEKLKELNPGYGGQSQHQSFGGKVTELRIESAALGDIAPLRALRGLTKLQLVCEHPNRSRISDLTPLKGLPLTYLQCDHAGVRDLKPIKDLKLAALYLDGNPVEDLTPLAGMPLSTLQLSYSGIKDLGPLKGMRLSRLRIDGTAVADLTPLQGMPLIGLMLENTKVTDFAPLKQSPLRELRVTLKPSLAKQLAEFTSLQTINDQSAQAVLAELIMSSPDGMVPLFNGRDLSGWETIRAKWGMADGKIAGNGEAANGAQLRCSRGLPVACEIRFTATAPGVLMASLDSPGVSYMIQRDPEGVLAVFLLAGGKIRPLGRGRIPVDAGANEYRLVLREQRIQFYAFGKLALEVRDKEAAWEGPWFLSIYAAQGAPNLYEKISFRDLKPVP